MVGSSWLCEAGKAGIERLTKYAQLTWKLEKDLCLTVLDSEVGHAVDSSVSMATVQYTSSMHPTDEHNGLVYNKVLTITAREFARMHGAYV